ncbi:MAG: response regulator transcription factor [Elusimicrobiota bacterium]|nr:response regulator transcription factor [Elusimicrobiota bacterium]
MAEKILLVDDEDDYLNLLRLILTPEGFEVETACDGEDALRKIDDFKPDLMILDVNMPKLDGHGVCKKVRENAQFKKLPIIMLTVRSNEEEEVRGLDNGCDDYVTKPFEPTTLVTRVRTVLRRAKKKLKV